MQIILMEKVVNLGGLGDVVKVKDGYARNFLIPQGKAKRATEANRKVFEEKRAELERIQAEAIAAACDRNEPRKPRRIRQPPTRCDAGRTPTLLE